MTTAELARNPLNPPEPTESQLLDVLYEVLAQGVPPRGGLRVEDVQCFLHEHARSKKSLPEMLAFFEQHGLPTDASEYGADPELGELASGLHQERAPVSYAADDDEQGRAASESGPVLRLTTVIEVEDTSPRAQLIELSEPLPLVSPRKPFFSWPVAAASAVLLLAGSLLATYHHAQTLSAQLEQARLSQRSTSAALSGLVQRAEELRGSLEQSESERRELGARFEQFVDGEELRRGAEDVALERILGPRFEALREKAIQDAHFSMTP